ncbi:MAG TPA: fatty acyl-AMP ligase [Deltaproteobacteria bacterium]|nr:fatty acyl-AMP ligase [Deltaproteobacteria bacterium]HOI05578.1 fatty acyl-AMP ligase [Deltaproteobacteria bacterium]
MAFMRYRDARFRTVGDMLKLRSSSHPDRVGYVFLEFLAGEEIVEHPVTYGDLDRRAGRIAAQLLQDHRPGDRAILLYPPDLEYIAAFFACQYAGVVAVPSYPPFTRRNVKSLLSIVGDTKPKSVLCTRQVMEGVRPYIEEVLQGRADLPWLCTEELEGPGMPDKEVVANDVSFLQYTSGSTSRPRGVVLTHENLLHNLHLIESCFGHHEGSCGVIWLPPYHDMGLIGGILQPAYAGFPVYLFSPLSFLKRPLRWLQAISRYRATTSGGPNFAYELCLRKVSPGQREGLDLSSWDLAFNGAEPVLASTVERFSQAFEASGFDPRAFYPCYGLAESTLIVSGGRKGASVKVRTFDQAALYENTVRLPGGSDTGSRTYVGCGSTLEQGEIVIVDPETMSLCPRGGIGEIWVRGPSVASGYWNNPEATECTFRAYLKDTRQGPFLRTGDLGFLHEGELFITGRLKDILILRGRNVYPQDIERTAEESHPGLRKGCNAAFAVDVHSENGVVLLQELTSDYEALDEEAADEISSSIRTAVAVNHGVQLHDLVLLKSNSLLKTTSGKIQRKLCRREYLAGRLERVSRISGVQPGGGRREDARGGRTSDVR